MAKKTITVTLKMSEIIYDIQNKTYLTGRSRADGKNVEAVSDMQADNDDENLNQILRSAGDAIKALTPTLHEYLVDNESLTAASNTLTTTADVHVVFSVPTNFHYDTAHTVATAIHDFVVNTAVADWFNITDKPDAKEYLAAASAALELLKSAISARKRLGRTRTLLSQGEAPFLLPAGPFTIDEAKCDYTLEKSENYNPYHPELAAWEDAGYDDVPAGTVLTGELDEDTWLRLNGNTDWFNVIY